MQDIISIAMLEEERNNPIRQVERNSICYGFFIASTFILFMLSVTMGIIFGLNTRDYSASYYNPHTCNVTGSIKNGNSGHTLYLIVTTGDSKQPNALITLGPYANEQEKIKEEGKYHLGYSGQCHFLQGNWIWELHWLPIYIYGFIFYTSVFLHVGSLVFVVYYRRRFNSSFDDLENHSPPTYY